ncbi:MAG: OB-fold nucleic acid binding domain-containing protein [Streptosporangiaceae bacterium]
MAGRVYSVEIRPVERNTILACTIANTGGEITALFYGRTHIPGLRPGSLIRLRGTVSVAKAGTVMINPAYELLD